ncbi:M48 family peptidase [Brevundimonas sp. S30B]|uniref:M48 family metallopeptidase n=1 Tax=unclassified Brevundimonas TaxID=2622653 RepID=UPI001072CBD1|nr:MULTISPECIES: SprT family zinc-dependent metalloprotease [unclassified Brevundimonas]QBX36846.1 M48 family peptidase [Brevundimonas sp. MF30-B]TFW04359.1 M48 family peptidase [Brevundimonas sp. S30B]
MRFSHGQRLPPEDGVPALLLTVNPRARRLSVRIDARRGEAVVVAPSQRSLAQAVAFARSRGAWIAERLAARAESRPLEPGATVSLKGRPIRLEATGGAGAARLVERDGEPVILSGGEGEAFARRVENLFKRQARDLLTARTEHHLASLGGQAGRGPVRISIVDTRSRWGSCSPHNRSIRYSWRVVMAPEPVIDYLAAHEVAHLVHADHSPAYWAVVHRLVGDHRPFRRWLREHGAALHAVG